MRGPHQTIKTGSKSHKIRIDTLFVGPTDTWQPAIDSLFNFFFFRQKKKFLKNRRNGFTVNDALMIHELVRPVLPKQYISK